MRLSDHSTVEPLVALAAAVLETAIADARSARHPGRARDAREYLLSDGAELAEMLFGVAPDVWRARVERAARRAARLTEQQRRELCQRHASGEQIAALAREYGISRQSAWWIVKKRGR